MDCDNEELITKINRPVHDNESSEKGYGDKTRNVKVDIKYELRILPSVSLLTHALTHCHVSKDVCLCY